MGEGTQLGLMMGNVIGPAYVSAGRGVVTHEVDYTLDAFSADFRGADTMRGGALDVMFSCSVAVSSYGCADVCHDSFFHTLDCMFLRWSGYMHWSADTAFVRELMDLFGFRVGVVPGGGVQFELIGQRTWFVGAGCGLSIDLFCQRLDGCEEFDSSARVVGIFAGRNGSVSLRLPVSQRSSRIRGHSWFDLDRRPAGHQRRGNGFAPWQTCDHCRLGALRFGHSAPDLPDSSSIGPQRCDRKYC